MESEQFTAADDAVQAELEYAYHKHQALPLLRQFFNHDAGNQYLLANAIPPDFGVELMAQIYLHKRMSFGAMIGLLAGKVERMDILPDDASLDALYQETANILVKCIDAEIVSWDAMASQLVVLHDEVGAALEDDIRRYQFPLPMVVEPAQLESNRDTGYLTEHVSKGSVILKRNHTDQDVCLDHLNRMNGIALKLNFSTVQSVSNQWSNISHQKAGESDDDYTKRLEAFNRYNKHAAEVIEMMAVAGNKFWMVHRYDKRGRTYPAGYHINPQGSDWNKSVIELAEEEEVIQS